MFPPVEDNRLGIDAVDQKLSEGILFHVRQSGQTLLLFRIL